MHDLPTKLADITLRLPNGKTIHAHPSRIFTSGHELRAVEAIRLGETVLPAENLAETPASARSRAAELAAMLRTTPRVQLWGAGVKIRRTGLVRLHLALSVDVPAEAMEGRIQ